MFKFLMVKFLMVKFLMAELIMARFLSVEIHGPAVWSGAVDRGQRIARWMRPVDYLRGHWKMLQARAIVGP
jgi:hypothetical protein